MPSERKPQDMMLDAAIPEVRSRAAAFVRMQWPQHAEKRLQQELGISEASAERILARAASNNLLSRMMVRWGWPFAHFVLEPLCGSVDRAALLARVRATEQQARAALREAGELRAILDRGQAGADRTAADPGRLGAGAPGAADDPAGEVAAERAIDAWRPGRRA